MHGRFSACRVLLLETYKPQKCCQMRHHSIRVISRKPCVTIPPGIKSYYVLYKTLHYLAMDDGKLQDKRSQMEKN